MQIFAGCLDCCIANLCLPNIFPESNECFRLMKTVFRHIAELQEKGKLVVR